MKTAAIYNVWDGIEFLVGSMRCLKKHVDVFIIVYQNISNYGEPFRPFSELNVNSIMDEFNVIWIKYHPTLDPGLMGAWNERSKRQMGIDYAKELGCTHFILMDCDEYYEDFGAIKDQYIQSGAEGSVVSIFTYFKSPELRQEERDKYYVPFIHKLNQNTICGSPNYPYYVDPTRRINTQSVALLQADMHHFSWVRNDIRMKAENSSARRNIEKSSLLAEYLTAKEGSIVNGGFKLIKVEDRFGIKKMLKDI